MPSLAQSQHSQSTQPPSSATSTTRGRKRAASFTDALRKLLPRHKPERGRTLRKHGYHCSESLQDTSLPISQSGPSLVPCSSSTSSRLEPSSDKIVRWNTAVELGASPLTTTDTSSPGSRSLQLYLERRYKRRQRRSLKESGDYLGVQGINPTTGEMDALTPSSSSAATTSSSLLSKREAYERARRALRAEKMRKWEMDKDALKRERRRKVRWTRRVEGWSSVLEPELSPITGSSPATSSPERERRRPDPSTGTGTVVKRFNTGTKETGSNSRDGSSTVPASSMGTGSRAFRRKPVPSPVPHSTAPPPSTIGDKPMSSTSSYSNLIPVETEIPPRVGPKPMDWRPVEDQRAASAEIVPSDSVSNVAASRSYKGADAAMPSWGRGRQQSRSSLSQRQISGSASSATRQSSASKKHLLGCSRATPESHLCWPEQNSQISRHKDAVEHRGSTHRTPECLPDSKICVHTHHHHYWIVSDSDDLQKATPRMRTLNERHGLAQQVTAANGKFDRTMATWPTEVEVEALTQAQRPPSADTTDRYLIG